jgi:hypothetical protein
MSMVLNHFGVLQKERMHLDSLIGILIYILYYLKNFRQNNL